MGFRLESIVPWGRSFDEYVSMFALTDGELNQRILGCGDGPAGFNAALTRRGGRVTSIDPLYCFTAEEISRRISETYATVIQQTNQNRDAFTWNSIASVEELGRIRMAAMNSFLEDFESGRKEGRYIAGELPVLPFADGAFEISLTSHLLFLYSNRLSADFHLQALNEMLRVSREARIFPLLTLEGESSPYLQRTQDYFRNRGYSVNIRPVAYEFQRGGNVMLVIKSQL